MTATLAGCTTFGIGGAARSIVDAPTKPDLIDAVRAADEAGDPLFVLSGGSNVLVADDGFPGTVVRVASRGVDIMRDGEVVVAVAAAGEPVDSLVAQSVENGWQGIEALSGIPGLVGAAPVQNIGAYGAEIASVVRSVGVWDRRDQIRRALSPEQCGFSYRDSVLKSSRAPAQPTGRYVVIDVMLQLCDAPLSAPIQYPELAAVLGIAPGQQVPLADVRQAVLYLRREKGMVYDADDPDTHGAGSFFTNPVVAAGDVPTGAPAYPQPDGRVKTSAAWLIEHAGFPKGYGAGPARVSSKHALALTNQGGATAADVIALAREIANGVRARYGIELQPEPVLVGLTI